MSFIGPRAWIAQYYPYYTEEQKKRFLMKPGLTGYAQAVGRKSLHILDRIQYDIYYVDNFSIKLDVKIVIGTIKILFDRDTNVYDNYTIEDEFNDLKKNYNLLYKNV